eukprot:11197766-Lingulodinium_polyedra.AAC.1
MLSPWGVVYATLSPWLVCCRTKSSIALIPLKVDHRAQPTEYCGAKLRPRRARFSQRGSPPSS